MSPEWERCRPWIEAALEHAGGTHGIEDVEAGLASGDYQFWPAANSAAVTEIITFPRKKALCFWLSGGDLSEMMRVIEPRARQWGEAMGCNLFFGNAVDRPGWSRALQPFGYAPGWRVFWRT